MKTPLKEYLDFAIETAHAAGRLTLGYFQTDLRPEYKDDDSPVTVADRKAEALIRDRIEKRYPRHAILGEEHGTKEGENSEFRWIIDPIDGTKAFIRGVPLYAVLIGLEIEKCCEVGVAYFPALDDMIYAATGGGCFWNGRRTHVAPTTRLDRSFVGFTGADNFEQARSLQGLATIFKGKLLQCGLVGCLRACPGCHRPPGDHAGSNPESLRLRPLPPDPA